MDQNSSSDKPAFGDTTGTLDWLRDQAALPTLAVVYMRVSVGRSASASAPGVVPGAVDTPDVTLVSVLLSFSVVSGAGWWGCRGGGRDWAGGGAVPLSPTLSIHLALGCFTF